MKKILAHLPQQFVAALFVKAVAHDYYFTLPCQQVLNRNHGT
jgi:hypothetical protein